MKNNWFTNSYREKEAKFRNNLPNEGKSEVSRNRASSGLKPRLPTLTIRRRTSSEFAAAYRNLSRAMRLTPGPLRLVQFPVFGLPMLRISRCNCSPLALFTFKAPGCVAPSVNFDPATTSMTACARRHPDHVLPFLLLGGCLPCRHRFQIKVQLCCLI